MTQDNHHAGHLNKVTFASLLVALGIVFGDIGTSPLYTFSAVVGERTISETLVLGGFSAIFWTLTIQTTIKYIIIVLSADNNGEGGVFSRRRHYHAADFRIVGDRRFKNLLAAPADNSDCHRNFDPDFCRAAIRHT